MASTATRQRVNTSVQEEITMQQSTTLMKNLMRTAISSIAYLRNLFPEDCFYEKKLTGLSIRSLIPTRPEAKLLMNWLEKGVFDALDRRYLSDVIFAIYTKAEPDSILKECSQFHVDYHDEEGGDAEENCTLQLTHTIRQDSENGTATEAGGNGSKMNTTMTARVYSKEEIRDSTVRLIRTLVTLTQTLKALPSKRFIAIKLQYRDDKTPPNYEPCFFKACGEDESELVFNQQPYKVRVGDVQTRYHEITMKMRTIVDTYVDSDGVPEEETVSTHGSQEEHIRGRLAEPDEDTTSGLRSFTRSATTTSTSTAAAATTTTDGEWVLPCNGHSKTGHSYSKNKSATQTMTAAQTTHAGYEMGENHNMDVEPRSSGRMQFDHRGCETDTNYDDEDDRVDEQDDDDDVDDDDDDQEEDNASIRSYDEDFELSDNELPHPSSPCARSEIKHRRHQSTPEDTSRASRVSRNRAKGTHTGELGSAGLSTITPRTKLMTEEFKARLQLKSAPTSQSKYEKLTPRCDYYALPSLVAHSRPTTLSLTERSLFNHVSEAIVQAGLVPRQQLLSDFKDDGLTSTAMRRFVTALEQRGVLESVSMGKSSRLRVTDLPNAIAIPSTSLSSTIANTYQHYSSENPGEYGSYANEMNDTSRNNPRRLNHHRSKSNMPQHQHLSSVENRDEMAVSRPAADPYSMSSLYGSPTQNVLTTSLAHDSTSMHGNLLHVENSKKTNQALISARLVDSTKATGKQHNDTSSRLKDSSTASVYSTSKRKGALSKLTAPTMTSNFQSRTVIEEEAVAARTRTSRKRVCVITSDSNH